MLNEDYKMRKIVYAANNKNGYNVLIELIQQGISIEYLIVHPKSSSKYRDQIIKTANISKDCILIWNETPLRIIESKLKNANADILFSVNFGYKIPIDILEIFDLPINLHISYLPYNKGSYPNVWPLIDGTPAGVSIHKMTAKFDEGEIFARNEVVIETYDDAKSLYLKLESASIRIVKEEFIEIVNNKKQAIPNIGGTTHTKKDFEKLCNIDLEEKMSGKEFINKLRALNYPPYKNAYYIENGKKKYIETKFSQN